MQLPTASSLLEKWPKTLGTLSYIECGDGWLPIIDALCAGVEEAVERHNDDLMYDQKNGRRRKEQPMKYPLARQIKEKFGTLRVYFSEGSDITQAAVAVAVAMSAHTCENCGARGRTHFDGWTRTLCDPCELVRAGVKDNCGND